MRPCNSITVFLFVAMLIVSCSDDGPSNGNPTTAALTSPGDQTQGAEIENVNLQWQQATDPDGDAVSYDVFLDSINPPAEMVAANLNTTAYAVEGPLEHNTTYYWRVTVKDGKGGSSQSQVSMFTTREATSEELIVGKWFLNEQITNGVSENLGDCQKNSFFEFDSEGMLNVIVYDEDPCVIVYSAIAQYSLPDGQTLMVTSEGVTESYPIVSLTETELKLMLGSNQNNFIKDN